MKMIPISEIDLLIKELKDSFDGTDAVIVRRVHYGTEVLEKLRKKTIPAIPISKIDEINELIPWNMTPSCNMAKKKLEDLKK